MSTFKPMLATDVDLEKLKFPCLVLPKIDGVRGLNCEGKFTGRSLKQFANLQVTRLFNGPRFDGFDGELAVSHETDPDLCRKTSSATSKVHGEYVWTWHVFDLCDPGVAHLPYKKRYEMMAQYVNEQQEKGLLMDLKVVPYNECNSIEEVLEWEATYLEMGYEGIIVRDPEFRYKHGRATQRENSYLRLKRFADAEGEVLRIIEGTSNENEAQTNELGQTFRSSHKENMVPNGMIGSYVVKMLTVPDGLPEHIKLEVGDEMTVSAGKMTHEERLFYFQNPDKFIGEVTKFKFFLHGMKDKLRIPTHQCFRDRVDMSD